ncbi:UNVERIFIED_CONTAM: hypothetical protein Sindi_2984000 [Sesamum indicum]
MSDSLVRVSRRVEWGARWPAPGARSCRGTPWARAVRHDRGDGVPRAYPTARAFGRPPQSAAASAAPSDRRTGLSPFHIRPGRIAGPHPLPPDNFKHSLTLFSKSLFIFPSRYLFAIGLSPVFSLGRNLPPDWGCIPKQPDSPTAPRGAAGSGHDGALTLSGAPFQGTWARSAVRTLLQTTIRTAKPPDSQVGLFPVRSPLLGESFGRRRAPARQHASERSTTTGRDERRRGIAFGPTARGCAREANVRPPRDGRGGDAMRDAQADVPWPNGFGRNLRSKTRWFTGFCNSHQVSHFATFFIDARAEISVAESRFDIRETSPPPVHPADGATVRRTLRSVFLGACRAGGSLARTSSAFARAGGGGDRTGAFARARARFYLQRVPRSASAGFDNDPSAGSPTETLLRLLLPLNDKVQWTSRDVAGSEPPTSPRSEHFTGPFNR